MTPLMKFSSIHGSSSPILAALAARDKQQNEQTYQRVFLEGSEPPMLDTAPASSPVAAEPPLAPAYPGAPPVGLKPLASPEPVEGGFGAPP